MDDIRVGIVGMGSRGLSWLRTFEDVRGARVVAICDRIGPLLERATRKSGDPGIDTYTDFDRMIDDASLDAVGVVVEPHNQPDLICRSLEGGKHVVCEVPLAYTIEDCWRIVLAVEKSGLKFEMAEQLRYSAYINAWRNMVSEGTLGRVLYVEGHYLHGMTDDRYWMDGKTGQRLTWEEAKTNPRATRTRFWHMTHPILYLPHELSPMLKVIDDRVERVSCMGTRRRSYVHGDVPISDMEVAIMHTRGDSLMKMTAGFTVPTPSPLHWHHVMGTRGQVETNRSGRDSMKLWLANGYMESKADLDWDYNAYQPSPPEARASGHGGLDHYPLADFIRSIREDSEPELGVYGAAETAAPAILSAKSAEKKGAPQDVPDFRPCKGRKKGHKP